MAPGCSSLTKTARAPTSAFHRKTPPCPRDTSDRIGILIVVLGPVPEPEQRGDTVTIAIEPGQPPIRFKVCASTEGLHATAWAGPPLASTRRWHAYYHLGYDVDPTCNESEYTPDSSEVTGRAK